MTYSECFHEAIRSTLSTTKLFVNVPDLGSMCLVDQQQQLGQVSQSKEVSWFDN